MQLPSIPLALTLCLAGTPTLAATDGLSTLRVQVTGLRSHNGAVGCMVFASKEGFPDQVARAFRTQRATIVDGHAVCVFERLKPGTYAVMTLHDENGNEKMDKNFLGMPREGYGPSNNITHALSAPSWEEARFQLDAERTQTIDIQMKY